MLTRDSEEVSELIDRPHRQLRARHAWWRDSGDHVVIDHAETYHVSQCFVEHDMSVGDRLRGEWPAVSSTVGKQIGLQSLYLCGVSESRLVSPRRPMMRCTAIP